MHKLNFACSIPKMHYRSTDRSLCFLAFLLLWVPDSPYNIPHKNVYFVLLLLLCMSLSVSSLSNTHTPDRGPTNHYDLHLNVAHTSFHQAVRSLEAAEQPSHHSLASQNRGDNTDRRLVACNIWRPEFRAAASRTKPTTSDFRNQTPASVLPQKWNVICLGTSSQLKSTCLKLHQLQEDF